MNFVGFAQGRLLLIKARRWCEPFWRTVRDLKDELAFYYGLWLPSLGPRKFAIFWAGYSGWFRFLGPCQVYERKREEVRSSLKPESQFGIYIPEEAFVWGAKARNMNVVGPPKTLHIRGHNGCVLVVLHFWDWAWLLVWSLLILQHGFDRSTWAVRRRFLKLRNNRKKKGKKETKNT